MFFRGTSTGACFSATTQPFERLSASLQTRWPFTMMGAIPLGCMSTRFAAKRGGAPVSSSRTPTARCRRIGYRTIKPETEAVADMGRFLFHQQWFDQPNDPFHRAPSIISYDDERQTGHAGCSRLDRGSER